jgi:hypothetical protein
MMWVSPYIIQKFDMIFLRQEPSKITKIRPRKKVRFRQNPEYFFYDNGPEYLETQ